MSIKGFDKFREKLPALSGYKITILVLYIVCMIAMAFSVCISFDMLPGLLLPSSAGAVMLSFLPLVGMLLVEGAGFMLVWQMWFQRDRLRAKHSAGAYQRIFPAGFGGILLLLSLTINQYIPYYSFAPEFWAASPLSFLATPLEVFLGSAGQPVLWVRYAVVAVLLVMGILTVVRALQAFGFDYMTLVYMYFPEESKVQRNEIYSALRHPAYSGAILISLGGAFFVFTALSFAAFALYLAGFYIHVHFVEERELIQRFGDSYSSYRRETPAFFVSPGKLGTLLRFLAGKGKGKGKSKR